jgi:hypothetical protein
MFQLYHGENKLHFDEMMMMYVLYQTRTLTVRVDMSLHSDTSFWFRANQSSLFLIIKAVCLELR